MTDHHQLQWGLAMTPPDTKQLIERLRDDVLRLSGQSIDRGCVDSGLAANLASEAADEIERLSDLQQPDERDEVIAWLRAAAVEARNLSHCETVESQRMYRIGQHDALMLASDAIERGDLRTALGEG